MRRHACFLAILAALLLVAGAPASAGAAGERRITQLDIEVTINRDGSVDMVETITYDLGVEPRFGMTRVIPRSGEIGGYGFRDFGLVDVRAASVGADLPVTTVDRDHEVEVRVGDPDGPATLTGVHQFQFSYTYQRMVVPVDDGVLYHADLVGTGWTVPIEQTTVRILLPPGAVTGDGASPQVQCYAGDVGGQDQCRPAAGHVTAPGEVSDEQLRFGHSRLEPGQALTVRLDFPEPTVITADATQSGEGPKDRGWYRSPILSVLLAGLLSGGIITAATFMNRRDRRLGRGRVGPVSLIRVCSP